MSYYRNQNPISEQAWMESLLNQISGKDSMDDNWAREELIVKKAKPYFDELAKMIKDGKFSHQDMPDEGSVPELQTYHGEGDPEGLKRFLVDFSTKMPEELAIPMLQKINQI